MSSKFWDPRSVLDVNPEESYFTCVGKALSKPGKPRCRNRINETDRCEAQRLLSSLAITPLKSDHQKYLMRLACVTLCPHWHRQHRPPGDTHRPRIPQVDDMMMKWSYNIQEEIERIAQKTTFTEVYRDKLNEVVSNEPVLANSSFRMTNNPYRPSMNSGALAQRNARINIPASLRDDVFVSKPFEISVPNMNFGGTRSTNAAASLQHPISIRRDFSRTENEWETSSEASSVASLTYPTSQNALSSTNPASNIRRTAGAPLSDKTNTTRAPTRAGNGSSLNTWEMTTISQEDTKPSGSIKVEEIDPMEDTEEPVTWDIDQETYNTITVGESSRRILKPVSRKARSSNTPDVEIKAEGSTSSTINQTQSNLTISETVTIHSIQPLMQPLTPTKAPIRLPSPPMTPPSSGQPQLESLPSFPMPTALIYPLTPPDSDPRNLLLGPEQVTPLKSRTPLASDPVTPSPLPNANINGTPNSTAPLIQHSQSPTSPPFNEKQTGKTAITQINALVSSEVLVETVVYCKGQCGLKHSGKRDIWKPENDRLGWWQRLKCSFWYLVSGSGRKTREAGDIV